MKDSKFFSEQIRLWRIGKDLSLRKASKRFGISPRIFSNWERGMIPSDRQKERLSKELGLDRDVLFKKCEIGNLNALLKEKRLKQGLTRTELAKHLGYPSTIISCWEKKVWKFPNVRQKTFVNSLESRCMIDSRY